jgi:hypothetical protein
MVHGIGKPGIAFEGVSVPILDIGPCSDAVRDVRSCGVGHGRTIEDGIAMPTKILFALLLLCPNLLFSQQRE